MNAGLQIEDVDVAGRISDDDEIAARSHDETRGLQSRILEGALEARVE